jgi:hypothetical protein
VKLPVMRPLMRSPRVFGAMMGVELVDDPVMLLIEV